jgi:hypothetical protein
MAITDDRYVRNFFKEVRFVQIKINFVLGFYPLLLFYTEVVSIRKVLRPATSAQHFLGLPVSKNEF